jgi:cell wall-associated NlpC family hydrolase
MRLSLDGVWFRFAGASGNYDAQPWSITLTFEAELATLMRNQTGFIKTSRGANSRAQFIHRLASASAVQDLSDRGISTFGTYSPDPTHKEAVAKVKEEDRKKGLSSSAHLTIRGQDHRGAAPEHHDLSLTEAEKEDANELVYLSMLVAGIGESGFNVIPNQAGSDYGGVFQGKFKGSNPQFDINDTKGMARCFLKGGKGFQGGGAIALARAHSDWTPGKIALTVEGSRSNFASDAARRASTSRTSTRRQAILDAWGGASKTYTVREATSSKPARRTRRRAAARTTGTRPAGSSTSAVAPVRDPQRPVGRPGRMVLQEPARVRHRRLRAVLRPGRPRHDVRRRRRDAGQRGPVARRRAPVDGGAGTVFQFDAPTMPLDGRWLIWSNRLDMTQNVEIADLVLRRPEPQKKEPAPTTTHPQEDAPETGSARDRIVATAKKALEKQAHYRYEQTRPFPLGLFAFPKVALPTGGTTDGILYIDCSAFVTLVYKHAGVKDPNGRDYASSRAAAATRGARREHADAHGRRARTSNPQPGDMVFYRSPEHVGIYIGDGKVIEMGGTPGPLKLPVTYRSDRIGYWTFDLSDA